MSWSQWCCIIISSSVAPFSCPQSLPASGSFPMSRLFPSGGQSIRASASVLPMNIHGWFPLGLTGLISLLSKGLSSIFPTPQLMPKASILQALSLLYGAALTVYGYWKNHSFDYTDLCWQSDVSAILILWRHNSLSCPHFFLLLLTYNQPRSSVHRRSTDSVRYVSRGAYSLVGIHGQELVLWRTLNMSREWLVVGVQARWSGWPFPLLRMPHQLRALLGFYLFILKKFILFKDRWFTVWC